MNPDAFAAHTYLDAALAARPGPQSRLDLAGADAETAAREFETFFLSQVFETLQQGVSTEPPFGGGSGETAWKSFLNEAYAKAMVRSGGIGLADRLKAEIIALQAQETQ